MSAPTATPNPLTGSSSWIYIRLNNIASPGTIIRNGVKGFKRQTGWDKKKGKGTQGATLTLTTMPPCEGEITCQLFQKLNLKSNSYPGVDDFGQLDAFIQGACAISPKAQQATGLPVSYPGFASIGLTKVVVEWWTPPEHIKGSLYHFTFKLCEWQQPPPVSIVKTVNTSAPALPTPGQNLFPDSARNIRDKATVARLQGGAGTS